MTILVRLLKLKLRMKKRLTFKRYGVLVSRVVLLWIYSSCWVLRNFYGQASCTLEAGVKIYSIRVDSVYSEAYKALVGINRASIEDEEGCTPFPHCSLFYFALKL